MPTTTNITAEPAPTNLTYKRRAPADKLRPGHRLPLPDRMALLCLAVVTHLAWFSFSGIIAKGDWQYWTDAAMQQLHSAWTAWLPFQGIGQVNIQIQFYYFNAIWSGLATLGLGFGAIERITVFIPMAILSFYAPFKFATLFAERRLVCYTVSAFFGGSTFALVEQSAEPTIAFASALAPLVLYTFQRARSEPTTYLTWIGLSLLLTVESCYEIRITLLTGLVMVGMLLFSRRRFVRHDAIGLFIATLTYSGLNLFWIAPTILGGGVGAITKVVHRGIFGPQYFDLPHAMTISEGAWTGGRIESYFALQPIRPWLWLIPLFAVATLLFARKLEADQSYIRLFGILAIVGIALSKESGPPFGPLYSFLYNNVPLFDLYREASKFYLLTTLAYSGLLAIGANALMQKSRRSGIFACAVVLAVGGANLLPATSGQIGNLFASKSYPPAYRTLQDRISADKSFYRVMWAPTTSRWSSFDVQHPRIGFDGWLTLLEQTRWPAAESLSIPTAFQEMFQQPWTRSLLEAASIKYIAVPAGKAEALSYYPFVLGGHPAPSAFYVATLNSVPWLVPVMTRPGEAAVFEVRNPGSYLSLHALEDPSLGHESPIHGAISDVRVDGQGASARLTDLSGTVELVSSMAYNSSWSLRIAGVEPSTASLAIRHEVYDGLFNGWTVDVSQICRIQAGLCTRGDYLTAGMRTAYAPDQLVSRGLALALVSLLFVAGYGSACYWRASRARRQTEIGTQAATAYEHR